MANLNQANPNQATIGSSVRYSLVDPTDTVVYSGKVVGICDHEAAKPYADVIALHQAMINGRSSLEDIDKFRFLIVECYDGVRRPVGFIPRGEIEESWCSTFELIETGNSFYIQLFNASTSDATLAIRILREQGFSCNLTQKK